MNRAEATPQGSSERIGDLITTVVDAERLRLQAELATKDAIDGMFLAEREFYRDIINTDDPYRRQAVSAWHRHVNPKLEALRPARERSHHSIAVAGILMRQQEQSVDSVGKFIRPSDHLTDEGIKRLKEAEEAISHNAGGYILFFNEGDHSLHLLGGRGEVTLKLADYIYRSEGDQETERTRQMLKDIETTKLAVIGTELIATSWSEKAQIVLHLRYVEADGVVTPKVVYGNPERRNSEGDGILFGFEQIKNYVDSEDWYGNDRSEIAVIDSILNIDGLAEQLSSETQERVLELAVEMMVSITKNGSDARYADRYKGVVKYLQDKVPRSRVRQIIRKSTLFGNSARERLALLFN